MMGNWESWFQDVSKMAVGTYAEIKYKAPLEMEKLRLQAMGPYGEQYTEGTPVMQSQSQIIPGVSNTVLVVAGVVALIFVMKD